LESKRDRPYCCVGFDGDDDGRSSDGGRDRAAALGGSLRSALTEVPLAFEAATGVKVQAKYGPSGLLKDEIAKGGRAEVFASANMEHPQALAKEKRSGPVVLFARNQLCVLARPGFKVDTAAVLDQMLDASVKLGTSMPVNDPAGDYAWEVFHKADALKSGASAVLEKKAVKLVGGADAPTAPPGHSVYAMLLGEGKADIFLTYCTNAVDAARENADMHWARLPDQLAVAADYGLTVMAGSSADAYRLALFILSTEGQRSVAKYGFAAPNLPD
jgi:molybdenum ABC transporter molybdate-binding protein